MFSLKNLLNVIFLLFVIINVSYSIDEGEDELLIPGPVRNDTGVIFNPAYNLTKVKGKTEAYTEWYTSLPGAHHASYTMENNMTADVIYFEASFNETLDSNITGRGTVNITAIFIGYNTLNITIYDIDNKILGYGVQPVSVLLPYQKLNLIFTYLLAFLIGCIYINMGATIDLEVVKGIIKKPIGPLVGIVCQYGIMPLIAFGLATAFFPGNPLLQLGMFLNGASPGGGNSNMWTFLLGGSLDLSIMMTFASTLFAFVAVPTWVLTMGPLLLGDQSDFTIPYSNIAMMVVILVVPCSIGILIQKKIPKLAHFLSKRVLAPFAVFNIIFVFTFGVYSHRYVFVIFNWKILLACFSLPALGYLSGLILAILTKRSKKEIIAISIETGVQNATIAIVILKFSLDAPAGDLTVVIPACTVIMTPIPLIFIFICKKLYGRFFHAGGKDLPAVEAQPQKPKIEMISNGQTSFPEYNGKYVSNDETGYVIARRMAGKDNPGVITNDE